MSIGTSVLRTEDQHVITGRTSWASNVRPSGTVHPSSCSAGHSRSAH
ncbi:MAG: hypothetical protein H0V49_11030 [Nocardioidaceae bacterium]|nr:hypothetical protein [Nocardioidaceae bacterium]